MTATGLGVAFFMQIFVILGTCRVVVWFAKRFLNQPQVVGEMIAGVLLGPSLFGLFAPGLQHFVFPSESKTILYAAAQLGVTLYMFMVGLDFQTRHLTSNATSAVAVSLSGIVAPFLAAAAIAPWLMTLDLFGAHLDSIQATLFLGAAMSITAFPVLARIVSEWGLSGTALGSLSLSAAALNDAIAWAVLALVLACMDGTFVVAAKTIIGSTAFALAIIVVGPKLLAPLGHIAEREGGVSSGLLGVVVMLFSVCAWGMETAGLHSAFGAFLLGIVMPRGILTRDIKRQLEPFALAILVPIFFAYSGLNTKLTMVNSIDLAAVTVIVLAASVLAKGVACWGAAKLTGQDDATAMGVGSLMNARGLMELIILNIGLEKGIIGPALFSILVLMAVGTTLMTSPLLELSHGRRTRRKVDLGLVPSEDENPSIVSADAFGGKEAALDRADRRY